MSLDPARGGGPASGDPGSAGDQAAEPVRITVLDILDHPTFSIAEDLVAPFRDEVRTRAGLRLLTGPDAAAMDALRPADTDGLVISGSVTSFLDAPPWLPALLRLLERFRSDGRVPVLAICMAHELIAELAGGRVERDPTGGELGTVAVTLSDEGRRDPLFAGFAPTFEVLAAHSHMVTVAPAGVRTLASNDHSPCQALRVDNLSGVQWHPDMSAPTLRRWLSAHSGAQAVCDRGLIRTPEEFPSWLRRTVRDVPSRAMLYRSFSRMAAAGRAS